MDILIVMILEAKAKLNVADIFKYVSESQCTVLNARFRKIQAAKALCPVNSLHLTISGNWHQLASFEAHFSNLEKQAQFVSLLHRTKLSTHTASASLPYAAHIIAPAAPDVLEKLFDFFEGAQVALCEVETSTYKAPITYISMLEISLSFLIPVQDSILNFREDLVIFCDENNFEITIEPQKNQ